MASGPGKSLSSMPTALCARVSIAGQSGVTTQLPVVQPSPDACVDTRKLNTLYPGKRTCQARYTDAACHAGLDGAASDQPAK